MRSVSVRWLSADSLRKKALPAEQTVKFAPWMIERTDLELSAVRKEVGIFKNQTGFGATPAGGQR